MDKQPEIHPIIREHLAGLDINSDEQLYRFLFPKLSDLPSPFLFKSMDRAVDLIVQALAEKHDILIWGDYDVDGISGTSLLYNFLKKFNVSPTCYIPNRLTDGYGLNKEMLMHFATELGEHKLLITVDCGISNSEELLLARRYGFKTIVTDHHQVPDGELQADATINPLQKDCSFPFNHLAGVGVAFYLVCALRSKIRKMTLFETVDDVNLKSFLGYVTIGTIADIMPLTSINRILVKGGMESIHEAGQPGITALFKTMDINTERFTSESIGFKIAPAINAAGRLGKPEQPLQMFTAESEKGASETASHLISLNNKRKIITADNIDRALALSRKELSLGNKSLVVIGDFHEGVMGIVASRMVDEYNVPALVCCHDAHEKNRIKGSGRAPEGFNLYELLKGCGSFLSNYGGHELAAGFSLQAEKFLEFKLHFNTLTLGQRENIICDNSNIRDQYHKLTISEALNPVLLSNLLLLEPTGEDNPKPIFRDDKARFVSYSFIGKSRDHLKGVIRGKRQNVPVIGFNCGTKASSIDLNETCGIAYGHSLDHYRGQAKWKVQIFDIWQ